MVDVTIQHLHACVGEEERIKATLSCCLEHFLIDKSPVGLCCSHHLNGQKLIGHRAGTFDLDKQIYRKKLCGKGQL